MAGGLMEASVDGPCVACFFGQLNLNAKTPMF